MQDRQLLAVEGWVLGCERGEDKKLVLRLVPGLDMAGVDRAGESALRKSV